MSLILDALRKADAERERGSVPSLHSQPVVPPSAETAPQARARPNWLWIAIGVAVGLAAGVMSGLVGIGGGVVIVPALVFLLGFTQQKAQGTTLALLVPPIGILAAWTYYRQGYVDLKVGGIICLGFLLGGLIGARIATGLPDGVLEKVFAIALLVVSLKMLFAR